MFVSSKMVFTSAKKLKQVPTDSQLQYRGDAAILSKKLKKCSTLPYSYQTSMESGTILEE